MKKKQVFKTRQVNPALQAFGQRYRESRIISVASRAGISISLMILHQEFGFGEKRLNRFLEEYKKQLEKYDPEETVKVLWEECGIRIEL